MKESKRLIGRILEKLLFCLSLPGSLAIGAAGLQAGTDQWVGIGPPNGNISSIAIDPQSPATLYAGTSGGGVFKSSNGGKNWSVVNNGLTTSDVWAIAIDPQTPNTVYAGTSDGGVFKSTNGGRSWSAVNTGLTTLTIRAIAVDPLSPSTVYAGTHDEGLFKSTNRGESWSYLGLKIRFGSVLAIAIDPRRPSTLYAGTSGEFGSGRLFKSTNGGGSWSPSDTGIFPHAAIFAVAIDPQSPTTLYAGTHVYQAGTFKAAVFKSTDGGGVWSSVSWTATNGGLTNLDIRAIAIDPQNPATIYAGTNGGGVFVSRGSASGSDFNGDSKSDLVWQNQSDGQIGVWFMNGSNRISATNFSPGQIADTAWKIVGIADFNSDSKPDLVWQNQSDGQIGVWFMDGTNLINATNFNPGQVSDTAWKIVATGDFNSDSKPDLVWQNQSNGQIGVWFMDGTNLINATNFSPGRVDTAWKIVAIGDFNSDSKPDLVWQNQSGHVWVWFMNGINLISATNFSPGQVSDTTWKIVGTGDFNSDSKPDLVWQNQSDGQIGVWFMDGINLINATNFSPGQVTDLNWKIPNVWALISNH